ncbi:MAG: PAS domain S-box protein [Cyanobacteria bacterium SZAS-4]|nr:PAS domain S-box protein [Cyanobacteria bacterium SZAS-4]
MNLRLTQKAMMLVAVPLIFELGFVSVLLYQLKAFDIELAAEHLDRDVLTDVNLELKCLLQAAGAMGMYQVHRDDKYKNQYKNALDDLRKYRNELGEKLKYDHSEDLNAFAKATDDVVQALDDTDELVNSGDRIDRMRSMIKADKLLRRMDRAGNTVIDRCLAVNKLQREQEVQSRAAIEMLILASAIFSIVLAIVLARYFNHGTSRRLHVLLENTYQLAMEKPLQPPLQGNDEIAIIDGGFHRMAESLLDARTKEQALTENALDVICSLDERGKFTKMNQAVKGVWGYDADELMGRTIVSLVEPSEVERTNQALEEVISGKSTAPFELKMRRKDQTTCDMSWSARWSESDKSLFCVAHDISERKRLERMKQEVVAMVSHDLRSPLTSIQAMFDLLEAGVLGQLNDKGEDKIRRSSASLNRLISMINDLLDMEKLESGMFELELANVAFNTMSAHALEAVQTSAEQKKIQLNVDASEASVYCDGDRIVRVLINFLSNAIKFSPENSTIRLAISQAEDTTEIEVIDQGKGIPADQLESVFERFKQVERADETMKGGSGLGLAICKAIVEAHHGSIGVRSEIGQGSTFWIRLPCKKSNEKANS